MEVFCPIKECKKQGLFSISKELNIQNRSIDPPILFCHEHFPEMLELYSIYKGLETMNGFQNLFCDDSWWQQLKIEEGLGILFLRELHDSAELSVVLRSNFQSKLKDEIENSGHLYFIAKLQESVNRLKDFLDHGGQEWTVVRCTKKKIRKIRKIRKIYKQNNDSKIVSRNIFCYLKTCEEL